MFAVPLSVIVALDHLTCVLWWTGPLVQQDGDGRWQDNHFPRHRRLGEWIPRRFPCQRGQLAPETPRLHWHPRLESCHLQRALRPGESDPHPPVTPKTFPCLVSAAFIRLVGTQASTRKQQHLVQYIPRTVFTKPDNLVKPSSHQER